MNVITPEEQKAIEAFLAEKGPTKIPKGQSGFRPLIWHTERNRSGELREVNEDGTLVSVDQRRAEWKKSNGRRVVTSSRRGKVRSLSKDLTIPEIAKHLGVSADIIRRDFWAMGLKAKMCDRAKKNQDQSEKNRTAIQKALDEGCTTAQEVRQATGLRMFTVRRHLKRMGVE